MVPVQSKAALSITALSLKAGPVRWFGSCRLHHKEPACPTPLLFGVPQKHPMISFNIRVFMRVFVTVPLFSRFPKPVKVQLHTTDTLPADVPTSPIPPAGKFQPAAACHHLILVGLVSINKRVAVRIAIEPIRCRRGFSLWFRAHRRIVKAPPVSARTVLPVRSDQVPLIKKKL